MPAAPTGGSSLRALLVGYQVRETRVGVQPLEARVQQPRRIRGWKQVEGQEARGLHELAAPSCGNLCQPGCPLTAPGPRVDGPLCRHHRILRPESEPFPLPGLQAAASVVGERVPQEDEDQDDAGGGQGGAGDVEQPGGLGVLHRAVQVVEQLLVPDLRPEER